VNGMVWSGCLSVVSVRRGMKRLSIDVLFPL
jgi:hypothetical protein